MGKLTNAQALDALKDVLDNRGTMWRTSNPSLAWKSLLNRGWAAWNPWVQRYLPTPAGRAALEQSNEA